MATMIASSKQQQLDLLSIQTLAITLQPFTKLDSVQPCMQSRCRLYWPVAPLLTNICAIISILVIRYCGIYN